jgi:hypothetical protein
MPTSVSLSIWSQATYEWNWLACKWFSSTCPIRSHLYRDRKCNVWGFCWYFGYTMGLLIPFVVNWNATSQIEAVGGHPQTGQFHLQIAWLHTYKDIRWLYPFLCSMIAPESISPIHAHALNYFQGSNQWKCMTWLNMSGHYSLNGNGCNLLMEIVIYND